MVLLIYLLHWPDVLLTNSIKARKETKNTDPHDLAGIIVSSSTTALLKEVALISLCQLSNAENDH